MEISTSEFPEFYVKKKEEGLKDKEIAKLLDITQADLCAIKKFLKVPSMKCRPNRAGLTEAQLRIAEENGIGRRLALKRRRELGYSVQDAISAPKMRQGSRLMKLKGMMKSYENE